MQQHTMYADLDLDFNFSKPQYQDDWGHQTHASYPDPESICLNEYVTFPGYSYHGELYGPTNLYDDLKRSIPISPVYTKLWNEDGGSPRHYEDLDWSAHYTPEPACYRKQREDVWESQCAVNPCRCGVDEHWVGDLPNNVDICRSSCCRQGSCQAGSSIYPRGSCRSAQCPRVSTECYRGCATPWYTSCFPRLPLGKEQREQRIPRLQLIEGFASREDEDGGGGLRGKASRAGTGTKGSVGGKRGKQGQGGARRGKKGGGEKELKVTDYEQGGTGYGPYGGPGGGYGGPGGGYGGPGGGYGGPGGAYGGPGGAYGGAGMGGYYGFGRRIPCPGPRPLCPGPGVCGGPKRVCPGPKKSPYKPVCIKTSGMQKKTCPGPAKASKPARTICGGPAKCAGVKSAPPKSCGGGKK